MMHILVVMLCLVASAFADPNRPEPRNIQFWGTVTEFIVIEEYSLRVIKYRAVDPNLCADFSGTIDDARAWRCNSEAALHYLSYKWPYFTKSGMAMENMAILSRYWKPVVTEKVVVVEPNTVVVEPNVVEPNMVDFQVWVSEGGGKYHCEDCRYAKTAKPINIIDAVNKGCEPCKVCKPMFSE